MESNNIKKGMQKLKVPEPRTIEWLYIGVCAPPLVEALILSQNLRATRNTQVREKHTSQE